MNEETNNVSKYENNLPAIIEQLEFCGYQTADGLHDLKNNAAFIALKQIAQELCTINAKRDEAYDVAKERARIAIHDSHELETNEHDFAILDGFDAGYLASQAEAQPEGDETPCEKTIARLLYEYRRSVFERSLNRFQISRERKSVNDHIAEVFRDDEQEYLSK